MNVRAKSALKKWPWLAGLAAPVVLLGADNLLGPALSGNAVQRALQAPIKPMLEEMEKRLTERMDKTDRRIYRACRERGNNEH